MLNTRQPTAPRLRSFCSWSGKITSWVTVPPFRRKPSQSSLVTSSPLNHKSEPRPSPASSPPKPRPATST
jgi:hypothetical protein